MTKTKTLFAVALLSTVSVLAFAKTHPPVKNKQASAPVSQKAPTRSKDATKANFHKSAPPVKNKNKAHQPVKQQNKAAASKQSNSKGPGLEAY